MTSEDLQLIKFLGINYKKNPNKQTNKERNKHRLPTADF